MTWIAVILAAAVLALGVLLAGCGRGGDSTGSQRGAPRMAASPLNSREQVELRLQKLAERPAPKELQPGAMCYEMAMPPTRHEYVCPTCGEKTLYALAKDEGEADRRGDHSLIQTLGWELKGCRTVVKEIKGIDVELDESAFCRKCSPDVEKPTLELVVKYEGEDPHRVKSIRPEDLTLIKEFVEGKDVHDAGMRGQVPLKKSIKRLKVLLGVK
jgi:hypothetical protein